MDQAEKLREMVRNKTDEIADAVTKRDAGQSSAGNAPWVISVTSGKGGVGKTNIVGNLAVSFQRKGKKVLVFDADLGLANIDIMQI